MTITKDNDHVTEALGLLLEQFKGKSIIESLLSSYIEQVQDTETAVFDTWFQFLLDNAVGAQLDKLGRFVGEERRTTVDAEYRAFIKARAAINRSNGKTEEILNVLNLLQVLPAGTWRIKDLGNASFMMEIMFGAILIQAEFLLELLTDTAAGGVRVFIIWNPEELTDRFQLSSQSGTVETDADRGLANAAQTTGGHLSGVIG